MSSYPETFLSGPVNARRVWTVQPDRACLTGTDSSNRTRVIAEIQNLGSVVEASPEKISELLRDKLALPAYGLDSGPASFVPSGRVFIRLSRDLDIGDMQKTLEKLGFTIAERHSHFAFAAWLESSSGEPADALDQCGALFTLEGIESCEPEMLSASR